MQNLALCSFLDAKLSNAHLWNHIGVSKIYICTPGNWIETNGNIIYGNGHFRIGLDFSSSKFKFFIWFELFLRKSKNLKIQIFHYIKWQFLGGIFGRKMEKKRTTGCILLRWSIFLCNVADANKAIATMSVAPSKMPFLCS